jgi:hypothetical protein
VNRGVRAGTYPGEGRTEGSANQAQGQQAHAEGLATVASGAQTHAEGTSTIASGLQAHAEGSGTTASGLQSHTEGSSTKAAGAQGHAEGASTVASGSQAHAEGSSSTASGAQSHAEGSGSAASGAQAHVEGSGSTASGNTSHAQGNNTTASGIASHVEGNGTTASGHYSHAQGQFTIATRVGQDVQAGNQIAAQGDAQSSVFTLMGSTVDATPVILTANAAAAVYSAASTNVWTMALGTAVTFQLLIAAHNHTADEVAGWTVSGVIARPQTSGNARLVGSLVTQTWADTNASTWAVTVTADTTNNFLSVAVTGQAAKTIGWIARLTTAELAY